MLTAGQVIWAPDAFHDDDPELVLGKMRPWLILNNEAYPGHGDQYLCCALTSGSGDGQAFLEIKSKDWTQGHMTKKAFVDTETLATMKHAWIAQKSGRLHRDFVQSARKKIKSYLS